VSNFSTHGQLAVFAAMLAGCESGRAAQSEAGPRFDGQRAFAYLERTVAFGPRPAGSASLERLRQYLESELRTLGLEPQREAFRASTPIGELDFVNVYADVPGAALPGGQQAPLVVVAGHVDTKRLPFEFVGANDAGSSTAVLLELARWLSAQPPRPVPYRLLFLDGEESVRPTWQDLDNTYGSRHHVERLRASGALATVGACVLVDMVGDRDLSLTRELNSHPELLAIFFDAAGAIGLGRHVRGRARELYDDHQPFLDAGIPAVDLIDFEFGGPDNPWWHTAEDTLEKCSAKSLEAIGAILVAGLPELERWVLAR
jgi:hypothetical protein